MTRGRRRPGPGSADDEVPEHEQVHARLGEGLERLLRRHHDRLVLVERGVQKDGHPRELLELLDQPPVARSDRLVDHLHAAGVVDVVDGRDQLALVGPRLVDEDHERGAVVLLVPVPGVLGEDRRGERPERLAVLDAGVEDVLHVRTARVDEDRAVAERTRPELHPALEPADHVAGGDPLGDRGEELLFVE